MTPEHLSSRRSRARVALVAMAVGGAMALGACAPTPAPDPTPTPLFASEEEAFAAAEATYRAYIDAFNQIDFGDATSFGEIHKFTTAKQLKDDRKSLSKMHADGNSREGQTKIIWVRPGTYVPDELIDITVCEDVADVTVSSADGTSLVAPSRPAQSTLRVSFLFESGELRISSSELVSADRCEN